MGLIAAVKQGDLRAVQAALDHKAKPTECDFLGNTARHHAVRANRIDIAELLMAHGADPTQKNVFFPSANDGASSDEMGSVLSRERVLTPAPVIWSARGVWWWAGFMAIGLLAQVGEAAHPVAIVLLLGPFLATVAICAWWYSESKRRCRRGFLARALGYLAFAFGSTCPIVAAISGALPVAAKPGNISLWQILVPVAGALLLGAVSIGASHVLVFQRQPKRGQSTAPDR